jgi:hypothetical protein
MPRNIWAFEIDVPGTVRLPDGSGGGGACAAASLLKASETSVERQAHIARHQQFDGIASGK